MRRSLLDVVQETPQNDSSELKELIDNYIDDKSKESEIKARTSEENKQIKEQFTKLKITSFSGDNGVVKMSEEKHESFREDDLIAFLKDKGYSDGIIKTKEYIDFDALESAMYHEEIPIDIQKEMASCKDTSIVVKLRIVLEYHGKLSSSKRKESNIMWINPFVAGVLCTVGVELTVFIGTLIYYVIKKERNDGKDI